MRLAYCPVDYLGRPRSPFARLSSVPSCISGMRLHERSLWSWVGTVLRRFSLAVL